MAIYDSLAALDKDDASWFRNNPGRKYRYHYVTAADIRRLFGRGSGSPSNYSDVAPDAEPFNIISYQLDAGNGTVIGHTRLNGPDTKKDFDELTQSDRYGEVLLTGGLIWEASGMPLDDALKLSGRVISMGGNFQFFQR